MRPAQKAPENRSEPRARRRTPPRFNEAGAKSAGKPVVRFKLSLLKDRFNEAGAKSAGKPNRPDIHRPASMPLQ